MPGKQAAEKGAGSDAASTPSNYLTIRAEREVRTRDLRSESSSLWHCPRCGASMVLIQRFTVAELSTCMYFDSS